MTTFRDLVHAGVLAIGDGYRARNEELGGEGPVFLRSAYLQDRGWVLDNPDRFSKCPAAGFGPKVARIGDTVLTTKGNSLGRLGMVDGRIAGAVYSPHLSYWRSLDEEEISSRYLYYWAQSIEASHQIRARSESTDMAPYLSLFDQMALRIDLPTIERQRDIANLLGAMDDKIDLNRRMAETLEEMARALFHEWMKPEDGGYVFVQHLIDEQVLQIGDGYRAKNDELIAPGLPFLRAADLNGGINTAEADTLSEASVLRAGSKVSQAGDVAFTSKGTVGRFARVDERTSKFVYSPQVCFWRSLDPSRLHPALLYLMMRSPTFLAQLEQAAGQTDMAPYVSLYDQRRMVLPLLPPEQVNFGEEMQILFSRQALLVNESRTLATLRDTLHPRLISGELRIAEAEREVAAA